ncbi:hypothetical protein NDU88_001489 [Pleurodeles waltl]|uniref:Uncharacterized protein n=1 Tax=Pleurodeles waltl TaxID=8319 RepID=A0AAV7U831_PLEWA|nr:hypothetical protein NDU88_001489 [Pleurodeles waltl]
MWTVAWRPVVGLVRPPRGWYMIWFGLQEDDRVAAATRLEGVLSLNDELPSPSGIHARKGQVMDELILGYDEEEVDERELVEREEKELVAWEREGHKGGWQGLRYTANKVVNSVLQKAERQEAEYTWTEVAIQRWLVAWQVKVWASTLKSGKQVTVVVHPVMVSKSVDEGVGEAQGRTEDTLQKANHIVDKWT